MYYLLSLSNARSRADQIPDITNMTAPTGTITTIRNRIISHPSSLPKRLFESTFTFCPSHHELKSLLHIYSSRYLKYSSIQQAYISKEWSYTFVRHKV